MKRAELSRATDFWFKRQFDEVKGKEQGFSNTVQVDPFGGLYRKLTFNSEMKLMGGLLVGNAEDYFSLLNLSRQDSLGKKTPGDLFLGGSGEAGVDDLSDDSVVCLCQKVTKGQIVEAIKNDDACTIPDIKKCTTAGNGCGGCVLSTVYGCYNLYQRVLVRVIDARGVLHERLDVRFVHVVLQ